MKEPIPITLLRHDERHRLPGEEAEIWQCFSPQPTAERDDRRLGALVNIDEMRIPPGGKTTPRAWDEAELLTYIYQGAIACKSSAGGSCVLRAGEFQVMRTGRGDRHRERNVSRKDWAHIIRISLRPGQGPSDGDCAQRRFTAAQRRNKLLVVASPDGRCGSLRIRPDALIHSSALEPGHHLVHELTSGRSAWLQVVCGEATLGDTTLTDGDVVGVRQGPTVSLTARVRTELMLVDVCGFPREPLDPTAS